MKLKQLYIKNFLALREISFDFKAGFNIYWADNEVGKTTMVKAIYYAFYGFSKSELKEHDNVEIVIIFESDYQLRRITYKDDFYQFSLADELIEQGRGRFDYYKLNSLIFDAKISLLLHRQEVVIAKDLAFNWQNILWQILLPPSLYQINQYKEKFEKDLKRLYTKHKFSKSEIVALETEINSCYQQLEMLKLKAKENQIKFESLAQLKLKEREMIAKFKRSSKELKQKNLKLEQVKLLKIEEKIEYLQAEFIEKQTDKNRIEQQIENKTIQKDRSKNELIKSLFYILLVMLIIYVLIPLKDAILPIIVLATVIVISFTYFMLNEKKNRQNLMSLNTELAEVNVKVTELKTLLMQENNLKQGLLYHFHQFIDTDQNTVSDLDLKMQEDELLKLKSDIYLLEKELSIPPTGDIQNLERRVLYLENQREQLCFEYDKLAFSIEVLSAINLTSICQDKPQFLNVANDLLLGLSGEKNAEISLVENGKIVLKRYDQVLPLKKLSTAMSNCINIVLKMALLEYYDDKAALPLLIDDAFISLDENRHKIILDKLEKISTKRQIIYATKDKNFQHLENINLVLKKP